MKSFLPKITTMVLLLIPIFYNAAQAQELKQQEPAPVITGAWYADRRIYVEVTTDNPLRAGHSAQQSNAPINMIAGENFGVHIGHAIPMRVRVYLVLPKNSTEQKTVVDFSTVKAGLFSITSKDPDPDFKLVAPDVLPAGEKPFAIMHDRVLRQLQVGRGIYNTEMCELRLYIKTVRFPQPMHWSMEFQYATKQTPDGRLPDWQRLRTPDYTIGMSRVSFDGGPDWVTGNTTLQAQSPLPMAVVVMGWLGSMLFLLPVSLVVIQFARKQWLTSKISALDPEEKVWRELDPMFAECETEHGYHFTEEQVRRIVANVLEYAGHDKGDRYRNLTASDLPQLIYQDDNGRLLVSLLDPLMSGVMEQKQTLPDFRYAELVEKVKELIPHP